MPLQDSDNFIIGRGTESYKITYEDLKDDLNYVPPPVGTIDTPTVLEPNDGAGGGDTRYLKSDAITDVEDMGGGQTKLTVAGSTDLADMTGATFMSDGTGAPGPYTQTPYKLVTSDIDNLTEFDTGWNTDTSLNDYGWYAIAASETTFVIAAYNADTGGTDRIKYSNDLGLTWQNATGFDGTGTYRALVYIPEVGRFFASQEDSIGKIWWSDDGVTWTLSTGIDIGSQGEVMWSSQENKLILGMGGSSAGQIQSWQSTDNGESWTVIAGNNLDSILGGSPTASAYDPVSGSMLVGAGSSGIAASKDGVTWTRSSGAQVYDLCYDVANNVFVGPGNSNATSVLVFDADGIQQGQQDLGVGQDSGICYDPGTRKLLMTRGSNDAWFWSANTTDWTEVIDYPTGGEYRRIAVLDDVFIAIAYNGSGRVVRSEGGLGGTNPELNFKEPNPDLKYFKAGDVVAGGPAVKGAVTLNGWYVWEGLAINDRSNPENFGFAPYVNYNYGGSQYPGVSLGYVEFILPEPMTVTSLEVYSYAPEAAFPSLITVQNGSAGSPVSPGSTATGTDTAAAYVKNVFGSVTFDRIRAQVQGGTYVNKYGAIFGVWTDDVALQLPAQDVPTNPIPDGTGLESFSDVAYKVVSVNVDNNSMVVDGGTWAQDDAVEYQTNGGQGDIVTVNTDDNTIVLSNTGDRDNRWIKGFSVAGPSFIDEPLLTNDVQLRVSNFATTPPGADTLKEIIWSINDVEYSANTTNPWSPLEKLPTNSTVTVKVKYKGNALEDSDWSPDVTFTTGASMRSLFTRIAALESNDVTDDATDTALLTLIAGLAARIQALEESN